MDLFGIGNAVATAVATYTLCARQTGRTTNLLKSVKSGDRVCFLNSRMAKEFDRLCKEHNLQVQCIVLDVDRPESIFEKPRSTGRTIFDHVWIEEYYRRIIANAQQQIDELQRVSSGVGTPPLDTPEKVQHIYF